MWVCVEPSRLVLLERVKGLVILTRSLTAQCLWHADAAQPAQINSETNTAVLLCAMHLPCPVIGCGAMLEVARHFLQSVAAHQEVDRHADFHTPARGEWASSLERRAGEAALPRNGLARTPAGGVLYGLAGEPGD